eukprot:scaffold11.g4005.t1
MVYVSPGFVEMTGYAPEELLGRNCRMLQGPHTSRAAVAQLRDAIAEERAASTCLLNYRKDGRPADVTQLVEHAAAVERAAAAEADGSVEAQLRAEERFAAQIAEQLRDAEAQLPAAAPRCAVCDSLPCGMLAALSKMPVIGRSCSFLQRPADLGAPGARAAAAAAADANAGQLAALRAAMGAAPPRAHMCVLWNFQRGGRPFLNLLHVSPVRDSAGRVHYFLGVQNELTGAEQQFGTAPGERGALPADAVDTVRSVNPLLPLRQKSVVGQVRVCGRSLADCGLQRAKAWQRGPSGREADLRALQLAEAGEGS